MTSNINDYDISRILDCQDENTEVDYLCDGTERTIDLSSIQNPTYSNVTLTHGGYTLSASPNTIYTTGTGISPTWNNGTSGTVSAKDFLIDGVSIKTLLEERLNMLVPNPELEAEWEQLKKLGDEYRKLEADMKEKSKIWSALKKT
jgi:hypothetical protein